MVTKNQKKIIRSLKLKKNRKSQNTFVAEGLKVVNDFLKEGLVLKALYVLSDSIDSFETVDKSQIVIISENDLKQISFLNTPQKALALFEMPKPIPINKEEGLQIVLDGVQDPGNLGTIIRLCDWFDVIHLICSKNVVDCFNEKVVQATMGSLARVIPNYLDIEEYLEKTNLPIYGTFMKGSNIYGQDLPKNAIIVMGNEANGISNSVAKLVNKKIGIPKFRKSNNVESLNVAMATSILLSEFKRSCF